MVILKSQNKITDIFMILAWACPFNKQGELYSAVEAYSPENAQK